MKKRPVRTVQPESGEREIKLDLTAEMIETATAEIAATLGVTVEQARTAFAEFTAQQLLSKSTGDIKQLLARK